MDDLDHIKFVRAMNDIIAQTSDFKYRICWSGARKLLSKKGYDLTRCFQFSCDQGSRPHSTVSWFLLSDGTVAEIEFINGTDRQGYIISEFKISDETDYEIDCCRLIQEDGFMLNSFNDSCRAHFDFFDRLRDQPLPSHEEIAMNHRTQQLSLHHRNHGVISSSLTIQQTGEDFQITLILPASSESIKLQARDCFSALQRLREKLELLGWKACCLGSRKNVWPSTMSREMSSGLRAYALTIGTPCQKEDLVDIFASDEPANYCTVEDQKNFAKQWFESLGFNFQ